MKTHCIGLATSGNAGGVDQSMKVGGENQFLILEFNGLIMLVVYILILFKALKQELLCIII